MTRYAYDLHIHSCLSPCADDDMTPANIAGMASLNGLQLLALTDHNSCGNCPAFMTACRQYGIVPVPGMELTTAEEIHMVCLFPDLESAMAFNQEVRAHLMPIRNKPEVFGNQFFVNEQDDVLGEEEILLISATDLPLEDAYQLVLRYGGAAYPAHIDRDSNGIIAILGSMPEEPLFSAVELRDGANREAYTEKYGLSGRHFVCSSDSHNLWTIQEGEHTLELDDEPYSSAKVRQSLIAWLRGETT
ncbi:MAG: PHP domain-containing protein [Ruminococcaceae bacterium]|nr:PHP domain-containing protein [Oscillospiraceae bacterium]